MVGQPPHGVGRHVCRGGRVRPGGTWAGPHHLHSISSTGAALGTLLQDAGDTRRRPVHQPVRLLLARNDQPVPLPALLSCPQLLPSLHHHQVPGVADLPVQLVIVLLLVPDQGPLLSDVLLCQVDGVVQLRSWPHSACPEIGRLVWCRNRASGTSGAFPTPAVTTFPYPLGRDWAGQMVPQNLPVCLQPGDSQTTGHFPQREPSSTHPLGLRAGTASLTGLPESSLPGGVDRPCPSHACTQSVLKTVGED